MPTVPVIPTPAVAAPEGRRGYEEVFRSGLDGDEDFEHRHPDSRCPWPREFHRVTINRTAHRPTTNRWTAEQCTVVGGSPITARSARRPCGVAIERRRTTASISFPL